MQFRWSWRRGVAALALGGAVFGFGARAAYAHAVLEGSDPAPGSIVKAAPDTVTLRFNEEVEASLGAIKVFDTAEQRVDRGRVTTSGTSVRSALRTDELRSGTYVVVWRVQSGDGHPVQGAYTFSIGAPSVSVETGTSLATRYLAGNGSSPAIGIFIAIGRTLAFAGMAILIGSGIAGLFWARPLLAGRALTRVFTTGLVLTVIGTTIALLGHGAYVAGLGLGDIVRTDLLGEVVQTRYGQALLVRLALLGVVYAGWRQLRRTSGSRALVGVGVLALVGLALTVSFAGHAATGPLPVLGVALDVVHLFAVSIWFGGLVVLAWATLTEEPVPWSLVQRFSTIALVSVVVLVLSGAAQGWRQLGSLNALTETDYGNLLLAKVVVFLCVLPLAAYARDLLRRRITPEEASAALTDSDLQADLEGGISSDLVRSRLRRSVFIEIGFLSVVFGLTALLVNAVPGREVGGNPQAVSMRNAAVRIEGTIAPAQLGPNEVHLTAYTGAGLPIDTQGMSAVLTRSGIGDIAIPLRRLGPGHYYSPQFVIPRKGTWTLTVRTNTDAFAQDLQSQLVTIR